MPLAVRRGLERADHVEVAEPGGDLEHAEPEGRRDAEDGADDRDDVDDVAETPLHAVAEQRLERPPDRHGAALAVDRVREREARDDVDRPRVDAPVQVALPHRGLRERRVAPLDAGLGAHVVRERLGDAPVDEADAHPGGEQHREPHGQAEERGLLVLAEHDVAEPAQAHPQREDDEARDHDHVVPAEGADDVGLERVQNRRDGVREEHREQDEDQDDPRRRVEDARVRPARPGGVGVVRGHDRRGAGARPDGVRHPGVGRRGVGRRGVGRHGALVAGRVGPSPVGRWRGLLVTCWLAGRLVVRGVHGLKACRTRGPRQPERPPRQQQRRSWQRERPGGGGGGGGPPGGGGAHPYHPRPPPGRRPPLPHRQECNTQ